MYSLSIRCLSTFSLVFACFFIYGCTTIGLSGSVPVPVPTRVFEGPFALGDKSGGKFKAYGLVAFSTRATQSDKERHLMICEAYTASLPHISESNVDSSQQLVTVWPVTSIDVSLLLNRAPRLEGCEYAVHNYDLITSLSAYADAELAGADLSGTGPYLLAWSPHSQKGKVGSQVLVTDLSTVTTTEQALSVFRDWRNDIQLDTSLWEKGWNLEKLRLKIQQWADRYGEQLLVIID